MTEEQKFKCRLIYERYGPRKQLRQLREECAELIQATIKYDRNGKMDDYSHLCEELADVMIMVEQVKGIFTGAALNAMLESNMG